MSKLLLKSKLSKIVKAYDVEGVFTKNTSPGASQYVPFKKDKAGRMVTGYEFTSSEIEEYEKNPKNHPKAELFKELKIIEDFLRFKLDSEDGQEYLKGQIIQLVPKNSDYLTFDLSEPETLLKYRGLLQTGIVAPDFVSMNDRKYLAAGYYFEDIKKKTSKQANLKKDKNKAKGLLANFDSDKVWMAAVAMKLGGIPISASVSVDTFYNSIDQKIDEIKDEFDSKNVLDVISLDYETLVKQFIIKVGFIKGNIKSTEEGYFFQDILLGKSKADAEDFLRSKKGSTALGELRLIILAPYS